MARIFVVEDSLDYQAIIRVALGQQHELSISDSAENILEKVRGFKPELILLDVILPGIDGLTAASLLQNDSLTRDIPILFVTGKSSPEDIVAGLQLGADDYIVKPIEPAELRARCESRLIKERQRNERMGFLHRGGLHLNLITQKASFISPEKTETALDLTPAEFKLLAYLAKNEGRAVDRNEIAIELFGKPEFSKGDRSIDALMSSLRKKSTLLGTAIESVYGSGYRFKQNQN